LICTAPGFPPPVHRPPPGASGPGTAGHGPCQDTPWLTSTSPASTMSMFFPLTCGVFADGAGRPAGRLVIGLSRVAFIAAVHVDDLVFVPRLGNRGTWSSCQRSRKACRCWRVWNARCQEATAWETGHSRFRGLSRSPCMSLPWSGQEAVAAVSCGAHGAVAPTQRRDGGRFRRQSCGAVSVTAGADAGSAVEAAVPAGAFVFRQASCEPGVPGSGPPAGQRHHRRLTRHARVACLLPAPAVVPGAGTGHPPSIPGPPGLGGAHGQRQKGDNRVCPSAERSPK
jgi:hypothetical protein